MEEEQVMDGRLVVGMNIHREICVLQMIGGVAILPEQVSGWGYLQWCCGCVFVSSKNL